MECKFCAGRCIRNGFQINGKQRYKCKDCNKRQLLSYTYNAYRASTDENIISFTKEGLGIRSIARVLKISTVTLLKRILSIAGKTLRPAVSMGKIYEVDEMRSYIKRKDKMIWIVYALDRASKRVVSFSVGPRTNRTLYSVVKTLEMSNAKQIFTDGLRNYRYVIPRTIHTVKRFGTNHIERKNLSLRIHLKRLNRRTICFSKSKLVLIAILKIYFWL